jgi:chromosome segregation ATPase
MSMDEEERKLEILKAEAAIRELAARMAEASASTKQADRAAEMLEAAASSLKELNGQFRALMEDEKRAVVEERKSLVRAHESLDICAKDLQESLENLERKTESFETLWEERMHELLDARFKDLPQDAKTISNKLSFLIDQNEASGKRIQALQLSVEKLSHEFQGFRNDMAEGSLEIQELSSQVIDSQERISSLEQARAVGLSHRLRSAIIGGGLGMIFVFMAIRLG